MSSYTVSKLVRFFETQCILVINSKNEKFMRPGFVCWDEQQRNVCRHILLQQKSCIQYDEIQQLIAKL